MCGRYLLTSPVDALASLFGFVELPNFQPRWNIAPTQQAPVVASGENGATTLRMARWGLVPTWSKAMNDGPLLINARSETIAEKPSFREAFRRERRLVPADGFYEWSGKGKEKRAFFARPPGPIAFAGVATFWRDGDGAEHETFAIVTTEADDVLRPVHHRMPVVVPPSRFEAWLTGPPDAQEAIMAPPEEPVFALVEVDRRVGDVRQDDAGLIEPAVAEPPPRDDQMSLF